jgi:hypothetical protein
VPVEAAQAEILEQLKRLLNCWYLCGGKIKTNGNGSFSKSVQ